MPSEGERTAAGMDADRLTLADTMTEYGATFARTGDPNPASGDAPFRPGYGTSGRYQRLVAPTPEGLSTAAFAAEHHCSFWASSG